MLSNAFDKSRSTTSVTFFASIASSALFVIMTLRVSHEWGFLLPLWCSLRRFLVVIYVINWFRATRSQIFDAAGSNETGRLLFGISWSPSFRSGMTSDIFHAAGKTDDNKDRFTMSVSTGRMQGSASLITDMVTLSNPLLLESSSLSSLFALRSAYICHHCWLKFRTTSLLEMVFIC